MFKKIILPLVFFCLPFYLVHADTTSNLVGWWKLDDASGTSTVDSSGNNQTGTLTNGPTWTTGVFNGALHFDGVDDYVDTSYRKSSGDGTISAWFKAWTQSSSSASVIRPIVRQGSFDGVGGVSPEGILISMYRSGSANSGQLSFIWGGDGVTARSPLTYDDDRWHLVVMTHSGNTLVGYVDGQQVVVGTSTDSVNTSSNLQIGGSTQASVQKFKGDIDDVRMYSRSLLASEILDLYNFGLTPVVITNEASLVGTSTAILNGSIIESGNIASSTVRGFVYGTTTAYGATTTENGTFGAGSFSANLIGLTPGTTYHFKTYASNATSTGYGYDQTFTTNSVGTTSIPTVVTSHSSDVFGTSFTLHGSITDTGGADARQSGFVYGTSSDLSIVIATTTLGAQTGTSSFSQTITGLAPNTTYYFKAYIVNEVGTSTGLVLSVTTLAADAPTSPTDLSGVASSTEVRLTWSAPSSDGGSPITDYIVEYKLSSASSWTTFNDGVSATTSATVTGLTNGVGYDFRVIASNNFVSGLPSSAIVVTPYRSLFFRTSPFISGQEGYNTFRIPALLVAPNGDLIAVAEGRVNSADDFGNIDIVMKRSTDGGQTWGALQILANNGTVLAGNPGVVVDYLDPNYPSGRIFLFYNTADYSVPTLLTGTGVKETWYKTSTDNGATWSSATNITTSVSRPNNPSFNPSYNFPENWKSSSVLPGHAIQLQTSLYRGRIVVGDKYATSTAGIYSAYDFYSDDHGITWNISNTPGPNTHENQIVELADGRLMMNARNTDGQKVRAVAYSSDGGQTWTNAVRDSNLVDPVVQASIHRYTLAQYQDKNRLLFINPADASSRVNLTVKMSTDEGTTWGTSRVIDSGASAYSDITILRDGTVGILYEYGNYAGIYFTNFDLNWISQGTASPIKYYPSLTTSLTSTPTATSGDVVTYTASITNATSSLAYGLPTSVAAQNVTYQMPLPSHMRLLNNSINVLTPGFANTTVVHGNSSSDTSVELNLDSLDPARTYRVSYQAEVLSDFSGTTTLMGQATTLAQNGDLNRDGTIDSSDALLATSTVTAFGIISTDTPSGGSGAVAAGGSGGGSMSPVVPATPTSVATSSSSYTPSATYAFTFDLQMGTVSSEVTLLQQYLNAQGFIIAKTGPGSPGNESSYFGALTKAALIKFQRAHNISPASGYFGPLTQAYIANTSAPVSASFSRNLTLGSEGDDVRLLQSLLIQKGYVIPAGATGYFGEQTRQALASFQRAHNITPSVGYFGEKTREVIDHL